RALGGRHSCDARGSGRRCQRLSGAGRYGASGVVLGRARILTWHRATLRFAPSLRPSQPPRLAPSRDLAPACGATQALPPVDGAGRGDTGRLEVVSKSRRQALRSCAVGLFLLSKPHARRSGKAGSPFLRPLLALSLAGAGPSAASRPRL